MSLLAGGSASAAVDHYILVNRESANDGSPGKGIAVTCPEGYRVSGGGGEAIHREYSPTTGELVWTAPYPAQMTSSRPQSETRWWVSAEKYPRGQSWILKAWAVCVA